MSMSALTNCKICGMRRCCVKHKVCTKCEEGFQCSCGLDARFCIAITVYCRDRLLQPLHRQRIMQARKEIFLLLAKCHNYTGESYTALPLAEHARLLAAETKCERTTVQANKRLFFANYSAAGYNGDRPIAQTTQLEMSAVKSYERMSKTSNYVGAERPTAFWRGEPDYRIVGREFPETNGQVDAYR